MKDLRSCRILVTPTSFGKSDPGLRAALEAQVGKVVYNPENRPLTSAEMAGLLPGCDGYIAGLDEIDRAALAAADRLKVIARYGVGVDNVDLGAARERGIVVTNTPGVNSVSVAELTITLILALARNLSNAVAATRAGDWPHITGLSLEGKTVGLFGLGAIGRQVVRRLAAFDCRLVAYDPAPDHEFARAHRIGLLSPQEVLAGSDFVSLHVPLLPATRAMVDAAWLSAMKPGSYLVNTARGELVDEAALLEALRRGHLRGAALDVLVREPPGQDHPLLQLPQVIVTPHCASRTDGATNQMGGLAMQDCLAVLRGETPRFAVSG
jgi:D-3-phosphoglycerate dehydrogenase